MSSIFPIDPNYKDAVVRLAEIEEQSHISDLQVRVQEAIAGQEWQTARKTDLAHCVADRTDGKGWLWAGRRSDLR